LLNKLPPTIFHVTHVKSGSQWVYNILEDCDPGRIVKPMVKVAQFFEAPIQLGKIYPTVYVSHGMFESTLRPNTRPELVSGSLNQSPALQNWKNFVEQKPPVKIFVVIRDLRDALVSLYFSLKVSHAIISNNVAEGHRKLNELDFEEGFLYLFGKNNGENMANMQRSWLPICEKGEALLMRYEDMIADEMGEFKKIINHCEISVPSRKLSEIVSRHSFISRAGRRPGEEDVVSHYRKGIAGDWENHFTDRIKEEFKLKFGQLLIDTGYEKDLNW
jgi:hypothetical protein